jgi:hypothetical protein
VDSSGNIHTSARHSEEGRALMGGLGLIGIITEVGHPPHGAGVGSGSSFRRAEKLGSSRTGAAALLGFVNGPPLLRRSTVHTATDTSSLPPSLA